MITLAHPSSSTGKWRSFSRALSIGHYSEIWLHQGIGTVCTKEINQNNVHQSWQRLDKSQKSVLCHDCGQSGCALVLVCLSRVQVLCVPCMERSCSVSFLFLSLSLYIYSQLSKVLRLFTVLYVQWTEPVIQRSHSNEANNFFVRRYSEFRAKHSWHRSLSIYYYYYLHFCVIVNQMIDDFAYAEWW